MTKIQNYFLHYHPFSVFIFSVFSVEFESWHEFYLISGRILSKDLFSVYGLTDVGITLVNFPYDSWNINCVGLLKLFETPLSPNNTIKWSTHLYKNISNENLDKTNFGM